MSKAETQVVQFCTWSEDEDGNWDTSCDEKWILTVGGPKDNGMKFCPVCGKRLLEKPYVCEDEEDHDEENQR